MIMLDEYLHHSLIPDFFGETYLETKVLYRDYISEDIVGESIMMVLDIKTGTGVFETKPDKVIECFKMHHSNSFNNFVEPYEHFLSFLIDVNYEERVELHPTRIAFISHVRVFNDFKGKGYGKEIMDSLNRFCKADNIDIVFLHPSAYGETFETETLKMEATERLYRFYTKAGFKEYPHGGKNHLSLDHQSYMYWEVCEKSEEKDLIVKSPESPSYSDEPLLQMVQSKTTTTHETKSEEIDWDELPF